MRTSPGSRSRGAVICHRAAPAARVTGLGQAGLRSNACGCRPTPATPAAGAICSITLALRGCRTQVKRLSAKTVSRLRSGSMYIIKPMVIRSVAMLDVPVA